MSPKKKPAPEVGRKSAYVARNRAAILKASFVVLAEHGDRATVDQVAQEAGVALSTVYKHFKDKDELIASAIDAAFLDWESWMQETLKNVMDPLELFVFPMRLYVRVKQTHPIYSQMVASNFGVVGKILPMLSGRITEQVTALIKAKILVIENPAIAIQNIMAILVLQLINQAGNPKATPLEADAAIRAALPMAGISDAKAKKLTEAKLPL